jgi:hypothetical protein
MSSERNDSSLFNMEASKMKKLILLALVVILLPSMANAYDLKQGDPAFYFGMYGGQIPVIRGETWCDYIYLGNFNVLSGTYQSICSDGLDTFAVVTSDVLDWPIDNLFAAFEQGVEGEDAESKCYIIDRPGGGSWYFVTEVCISVPCDALLDDVNTLTLQAAYCDDQMVAQPDSGDCEDPNYRSGGTVAVYSLMSQDFIVVESPPALFILQDTLYLVEQGQTAAYIPFSICNGDPCAPATDYDYSITSLGNVGTALDMTGLLTGVAGGDCGDVYGILNAGAGVICTYDTLTIIAWDAETGTVYDTCVQAVHVIEPIPVPLFTAPVVTILVLAMILAAAVIMKRHAISKA